MNSYNDFMFKIKEDIKQKLLSLNKDRLSYSLNCYKLAINLVNTHENLQPIKNKILMLALFHDIGYSKDLTIFNFHALDGALYLDGKIPKSVVKAIAYHSNSIMLLKNDDNSNGILEIINQYKIENKEEQLLLKIINYIDSRVDNTGKVVTLKERYINIINRYGKDSIQAKANKIIQTEFLNMLKNIGKNPNGINIEENIERFCFSETDYIERPCSVLESIEESFKEIKLYKQGKIKFTPIDKLLQELAIEIDKMEEKDNKINDLLNQLEKDIENRIER